MSRERSDCGGRLLGAAELDRLALAYVSRYATTRSRLRAYLARKLRERGWDGDDGDDGVAVDRLVGKFARLGYVDDRAFAEARAASLSRRGYGARRIGEALRAAGIDEADVRGVRQNAEEDEQAWAAAMTFARKKRIGVFAAAPLDKDHRRRAFAAMLRAGHAPALALRIINGTDNAGADEGLDEESSS